MASKLIPESGGPPTRQRTSSTVGAICPARRLASAVTSIADSTLHACRAGQAGDEGVRSGTSCVGPGSARRCMRSARGLFERLGLVGHDGTGIVGAATTSRSAPEGGLKGPNSQSASPHPGTTPGPDAQHSAGGPAHRLPRPAWIYTCRPAARRPVARPFLQGQGRIHTIFSRGHVHHAVIAGHMDTAPPGSEPPGARLACPRARGGTARHQTQSRNDAGAIEFGMVDRDQPPSESARAIRGLAPRREPRAVRGR